MPGRPDWSHSCAGLWGSGGQGHIDSNWVVREVVARIEPDRIYQEVAILRGYLKYRDCPLGENSTVANDQDSKDWVRGGAPAWQLATSVANNPVNIRLSARQIAPAAAEGVTGVCAPPA